jgi:hypothetical protein
MSSSFTPTSGFFGFAAARSDGRRPSCLEKALLANSLLTGAALTSALSGAGLAAGYGSGYGNGYGDGYYGGSGCGYSPSSSTSNPYDTYGSAAYQASSNAESTSELITGGEPSGRDPILSALGLANKNGHLDWPLGLIALPGEQSKHLREQIESVILVGATNKTINSFLVEDARLGLDRLQSQIESNRLSMTRGTYKDAQEFLGQLDHALKLLEK